MLSKEKQEFFNRAVKAMSKKSKIPEEKLKFHARFTEDLGFKSLDTIEATIALEEEFDIQIPDEDAEKFLTVEDVIECLYSKLRK